MSPGLPVPLGVAPATTASVTLTAGVASSATMKKTDAKVLTPAATTEGVSMRAQETKVFQPTLSETPTIARATARRLTVVETLTPSVNRVSTRSLLAGESVTSVVHRVSTRALSTGVAESPTFAKLLGRTFNITLTETLTMRKTDVKLFSAADTVAANVTQQRGILRTLSAAVAETAVFTQQRAMFRTFNATVSYGPSVTQIRTMFRTFLASETAAGTLRKQTPHALAASASEGVSIASTRQLVRTLAVTESATALIAHAPARLLVSSVSEAATYIRALTHALATTETTTGVVTHALARLLTTGELVSSTANAAKAHVSTTTVSEAAILTKARLELKILTAVQTMSLTIRSATARRLTGTETIAVAVQRAATRKFTMTVSETGQFAFSGIRGGFFVMLVSVTARISRSATRTLSAAETMVPHANATFYIALNAGVDMSNVTWILGKAFFLTERVNVNAQASVLGQKGLIFVPRPYLTYAQVQIVSPKHLQFAVFVSEDLDTLLHSKLKDLSTTPVTMMATLPKFHQSLRAFVTETVVMRSKRIIPPRVVQTYQLIPPLTMNDIQGRSVVFGSRGWVFNVYKVLQTTNGGAFSVCDNTIKQALDTEATDILQRIN